MYFLTEIDENYSVKGSRDPLGFQVLWQATGRQLIPHLSTVSANLLDFQILCMAHSCKEEFGLMESDGRFEAFFLRFEQLMAYIRMSKNPEVGFNGVDRVRKKMSTIGKEVRISLNGDDQLLSNQKAYGIWGKYISPFREMKMENDPTLKEIFLPKINKNKDLFHEIRKLAHKKGTEVATTSIEKIEAWGFIMDVPKGAERDYFICKLLTDHIGNELLNLVTANPSVRDQGLFQQIDFLSEVSENEPFRICLQKIKNTEKTLCPLNRIFRYLQTKSYWKLADLEQDEQLQQWRNAIDTSGFDETMLSLATLHTVDSLDLVKGLVRRNEEISRKRGSAPWMQFSESGLHVNHYEGAFYRSDYDPVSHTDFSYFISTFMNLHKQLFPDGEVHVAQ
jgi:hypothetical protein